MEVLQQQQMTVMSSYEVDFDDDSWWEAFVTEDNNATANIQLFKSDQINQLYNQSSSAFFDEKMSKRDYFQICSLKYIMDSCGGGGGDTTESQQSIVAQFWKSLKQSYLNVQSQSTMNILQWILPDPSFMTIINSSNDQVDEDSIALAYMMTFWKQLYQAYNDDDDTTTTQRPSTADENQRPLKRRRLGRYREKSGFSTLLKGHYKLPAVYLLICVLKESALDWDNLYKLSHQLPTSFKTFSEIYIQAGLDLVGWNMICNGETMDGFSFQPE
jgi:hypothetical protein